MEKTDHIFRELSWAQDAQTQARGREKAKGIEDLSLLIQPLTEQHGKDVWENCALVLAEKTDEELRPHFCELFAWLQDANWPGCGIIFDRLKQVFDEELLRVYFVCLHKAVENKDFGWALSLEGFYIGYIDFLMQCDVKVKYAKGIELLCTAYRTSDFLWPYLEPVATNVLAWCGDRIGRQQDDTIDPYWQDLFIWLRHMDMPGTTAVYERCKKHAKTERFAVALSNSLACAEKEGDKSWYSLLYSLTEK